MRKTIREREKKKERLLVIRMSALGDVAMTIPAVYSVANRYPQLELIVLTRPFFMRLFLNAPVNVTLKAVDFSGNHHGLKGFFRLLRQIRSWQIDGVADLHNVSRSWWIDVAMMLCGKRVAMVDKMRFGRWRVTKCHQAQPSFVNRYANVFASLGYPFDYTFRSLFSQGSLSGMALDVKPNAIGIAPFARYATKTYPVERMERVVAMLVAKGLPVYLFGAREKEEALLHDWQERYPGCISLAGRFPIEEELVWMSCMKLMVTMDSANHHLASLVAVPVLSIWGSTTPACGFQAYGQKIDMSFYRHLPCQPCSIAGSDTCPQQHFACLDVLQPEQ